MMRVMRLRKMIRMRITMRMRMRMITMLEGRTAINRWRKVRLKTHIFQI